MKFLIITKPKRSILKGATAEQIAQGRETLKNGIDRGIVESVYSLVAGGTVWIVNAESHVTLARALRRFGLSDLHDVEVHPLVDLNKLLDEHLAYKTQHP